jgi:hypothetical protein
MVSAENRVLANLTTNVLSLLGEGPSKALFQELRLLEVSMKPEGFDIIKVDEGLKNIFGSAAELFMEQIYTEFKSKLSEAGIHGDEIAIKDENISAAQKISKLLALKPTT